MFNLFRSKKPIKSLANPNFPQKKARAPIPIIKKPKGVFINSDLRDEACKSIILEDVVPAEEMCLGEQPVDTTEIDQMLAELNDSSPDAKARQMFQIMSVVNENLDKNINIIKNAPKAEGDVVSREDILKLLQLFANYSHSLENYFKELVSASRR